MGRTARRTSSVGTHGWIQRVPTLAFVLVPRIYDNKNVEARIATMACRLVTQLKLMPLYPPFYFGSFMTNEELKGSMQKLYQYWLARSSRLVIACMEDDDTWGIPEHMDLDPGTFWVLRKNQSSIDQRGVSYLRSTHSLQPHLAPMKSVQVDKLLMQNLRSGLLASCL